ncbi:MAG: hypothetical protein SFH39_00380 [Candidatus Magnetobacterium sp. LHC-1]
MPDTELSIANMTGDQLIQYLNTLSQRQAEYSKKKIELTEHLKPIEQERAEIRLDLANITEKQRQTKIEIAACKYAIKSCAEGLT